MAGKRYDENKVIRLLSRNSGVNVLPQEGIVEIIKGSTTVGNGTWGKIDFLVHYCGYYHRWVKSFSNRARVAKDRDEDVPTIDKVKHVTKKEKTPAKPKKVIKLK